MGAVHLIHFALSTARPQTGILQAGPTWHRRRKLSLAAGARQNRRRL